MSREKAVLYTLKGFISEMPKAHQDQVYEAVQAIKEVVKQYGSNGQLAIGIAAIEVAETMED